MLGGGGGGGGMKVLWEFDRAEMECSSMIMRNERHLSIPGMPLEFATSDSFSVPRRNALLLTEVGRREIEDIREILTTLNGVYVQYPRPKFKVW